MINLHPKFKQNFLWVEKRRFSRFEAWLDLFTQAKPSEKTKREDGKFVITPSGVISIGVLSTPERWGWTGAEFSEFFELLKKEGMVEVAYPMFPRPVNDPIIIVKIMNFEKYQGVGDPGIPEMLHVVDAKEMKDCVSRWAGHWEEKYGAKPVISWGRESRAAKDILKQLHKDQIFVALERYFQDESDFVRKSRHSFPFFTSQVNRYLTTTEEYGSARHRA